MGFIDNLLNAIRNKYLNATGAERDLLTLIKVKDIPVLFAHEPSIY